MTQLAMVSTALGVLVVAGRLPGVIWPEKFRAFALAFPRSVVWGRVLMGIASAIAWVVVYRAATDDWAKFRPLVVIGVPVAYWLVIKFAQPFLAVRGAAALMLLLARVMVYVTDASDVPSRLVVTTLAYVWVIAAIWMTIAPHHVRDLIQFVMANNRRCRLACGGGVALGILLVGLGLFVY
jgi:hypothetical protein